MTHEHYPAPADSETSDSEALRQQWIDYIAQASTPDAFGPISREDYQQLSEVAEPVMTIKSRAGKPPIAIPTDSIVRLPGLAPEQWDNPKSGGKDRRYIRSLAWKLRWHKIFKNPGPVRPISGTAEVFVLPDGSIATGLVNNGAHTALASHKAGEEYVYLYGEVSIGQVDEDILLQRR